MSVAGISSVISVLSQLGHSKGVQPAANPFQQLGQDLNSGNISGAQSDYSSLIQSLAPNAQTASSSAAQAFSKLGQDLQSGNLSAAQQDFSQFQTDLQQASAGRGHGHHHHHLGGTTENPAVSSTSQASDAAALFTELGQDLQSGNLSAAQQAYASLQKDSLQFPVSATSNVAAPNSALNLSA